MTRGWPDPPVPLIFDSPRESETERLARALAAVMRPGDVVALDGPLGSGKTRLVRAFAEALGCEKSLVSSPTFGLVQLYEGEQRLVHIDAYRLKDADEFERMGGAELFDPDGITLIEWATRIGAALPRETWTIAAEHVSPTSRRYALGLTGRGSAQRIEGLRLALQGSEPGLRD